MEKWEQNPYVVGLAVFAWLYIRNSISIYIIYSLWGYGILKVCNIIGILINFFGTVQEQYLYTCSGKVNLVNSVNSLAFRFTFTIID